MGGGRILKGLRLWFALLACVVGMSSAQAKGERANAIVLIGGNTPHKPGVHDGRGGVTALAGELAASPSFRGMAVRAYPDGWPADPAAFAGAATIVWYFDGLEFHPLRDPARRAAFAALMKRGVGLVALHQAGTVLPDDERQIALQQWLGAVRPGMTDRSITTDRAVLVPSKHPAARGITRFTYADEFYPTLSYARAGVTPVATARLRLEHAPDAPPTDRTVAWAFNRPGGGRSFGFTGVHHVDVLKERDIRQMILNAIFWTAVGKVPRGGVQMGARP